jgi:hypothetical protein
MGAGYDHMCAVTTLGAVKCWGDNTEGQVGDGTTTTPRTTPVDVAGLNGTLKSTPTPTITPTETPSDTVANNTDDDDDNDGCTDVQELGDNPALGGLRNPHNFWDYADMPDPNASPQRDRIIRINDVLRVLGRFFTDDAGGTATINRYTDPLSTPPATGYHPAFDRATTIIGPLAWDLGPPDGLIRISDVIHAIKQFFHDCA